MTRLAVSTIVRRAELGEPSGYLHVVDLDSERISSKAVVPESVNRDRDPNPRGGVRGARGLATTDGRLLMANAERVFVLDASWTPTDTFEHPHLAGVHDLLCHG